MRWWMSRKWRVTVEWIAVALVGAALLALYVWLVIDPARFITTW